MSHVSAASVDNAVIAVNADNSVEFSTLSLLSMLSILSSLSCLSLLVMLSTLSFRQGGGLARWREEGFRDGVRDRILIDVGDVLRFHFCIDDI